MTDYKINVKDGEVYKDKYQTTTIVIGRHQPPSANAEFEAPYVARLEMTLGKESIKVNTDNGSFDVKVQKYSNTTYQRLLTLGKLVGKLVYQEVKSMVKKDNKSLISLSGLPAEANDAVEKARLSYNTALNAYNEELKVPKAESKLVDENKVVIVADDSEVKVTEGHPLSDLRFNKRTIQISNASIDDKLQ